MHFLRKRSRPLTHFITLIFLWMSVFIPVAQASMVSTDAVIADQQKLWNKQEINTLMERDDVKAQLQLMGVNSNDVQARVDALTDDELQQLSSQLNELPAGGDILGIALTVFIILVITDLLGATNIFPFIKPIR
ncbi:MAG: PA2779 family protein [Gammaproteobacteria bacterium]|nr:PA2779 family protein [Gammaproteobacteria bacterium]